MAHIENGNVIYIGSISIDSYDEGVENYLFNHGFGEFKSNDFVIIRDAQY